MIFAYGFLIVSMAVYTQKAMARKKIRIHVMIDQNKKNKARHGRSKYGSN